MKVRGVVTSGSSRSASKAARDSGRQTHSKFSLLPWSAWCSRVDDGSPWRNVRREKSCGEFCKRTQRNERSGEPPDSRDEEVVPLMKRGRSGAGGLVSAVVVSEGEVGRPKRKMRRNLSRVLRQKLTGRRSEASFHPPSPKASRLNGGGTGQKGRWRRSGGSSQRG